MQHKLLDKSRRTEIADLFRSVFTSSEGEKEGERVGQLSSALASKIDNQEIICLGADEDEWLAGAIFFSRLRFDSALRVYLLAPVAVSTAYQGEGVGQALINYGLKQIKRCGADIVITYGDPCFYSKLGFQPLPETVIQAPLRLSMPQGWQGQSLTGVTIPSIHGRPTCVKPFNDPVYW